MLVNKDNLHIDFRELDGHNKPFNFVVSAREAGKSTEWISKAYRNFRDGYTSVIIRRQVVDITEAYIFSIQEVINKFYDEKFTFNYRKGDLKEGVIFLYVGDKIFGVLVALSISIARIKSLVLRGVKNIFFDEFIVNPTFKEKYLSDEANRFKEIYNTFYRESDVRIKCYWLGNPYSHYNPYFSWLAVDTAKLKKGVLLTGDNWAIWIYDLKPELREWILKRNPLYEFDDTYTRYGFEGVAVNDEKIRLGELPKNYSLNFVFRINNKYLGIFRNQYYEDKEDRFYIEELERFSSSRVAYCFDFNELLSQCALISQEDKYKFLALKTALRKGLVTFNNIECYYLIIDIFNAI